MARHFIVRLNLYVLRKVFWKSLLESLIFYYRYAFINMHFPHFNGNLIYLFT